MTAIVWFTFILNLGVTALFGIELKTGTEPSWSPDGRKIIFTSGRYPDGREIYIINSDGSNLIQVTQNSFADEYPMWSPDGRKILFSSNREGSFKLYTMDIDGSKVQSLGITTAANEPSRAVWSPDGKKIAFPMTKEGNKSEINIANADGTNLSPLTNMDAEQPSWSPDGKLIAFSSLKNLYVIGIDGEHLRQLTDLDPAGKTTAYYPSWSTGSKSIFFIEQEQQQGDVFEISLDKSNKRNVTNEAGRKFYSMASPDGSKIVYGRWNNELKNMVLHLVNTDGTGKVPLIK